MTRRSAARGLALALALVGAAGCAGDGGDGGACDGAAGVYTPAIGPGTGTCSDLDGAAILATFEAVELPPGVACGPVDLGTVLVDGDCAEGSDLSAVVAADGLVDGLLAHRRACGAGMEDASCEHGFQVTFTRADDGP